jgi:hypothetical protein
MRPKIDKPLAIVALVTGHAFTVTMLGLSLIHFMKQTNQLLPSEIAGLSNQVHLIVIVLIVFNILAATLAYLAARESKHENQTQTPVDRPAPAAGPNC